MPRSVKSVKKRGSKFRPNLKNKSTAVKKAERKKKESKSGTAIIKKAWDPRKTPRENMKSMGLAINPNDIIPIKKVQRSVIDAIQIDGVNLPEVKEKVEYKKSFKKKDTAMAKQVVPTLEEDAQAAQQKLTDQNRKYNLVDRDVELAIYMIAKYDDDYQAMVRDAKNLYQYTPKQMAKKIKQYKESRFYNLIE